MGCWNNTCALTHLPIFWGDEVVMLANAVKTGPSHAYYHYFDEAMPIALPIYGKYDDYGRVEDYSMSDMTRQVLENMKFFTKEEETIVPYEFSWDTFIDYLSSSSLYIENPTRFGNSSPEYLQIEPVMYHRGAYELVENEIASRKPYEQKEDFVVLNKKLFQEKLEKNRIQKKKNDEIFEKLSKTVDDTHMKGWKDAYEHVDPIWGDRVFMPFRLTKAYEDIIYNAQDSEWEQLAEAFADELSHAVCFFWGLSCLRTSFFGTVSGLGSQSDEMYLHELLAKWTINHVKEARKEARERDTHVSRDIFKETLYWWN